MERIAERHITHKKTQCTTVAQSWRNLVWIFAIMSVLGLLGETLQHWIAFGVVESRAGLVWGPFSPIYGLAAVLLSVFLEPFSDGPYWFLFFIAAVVGGSVEYFASWAMETFWGVVAWSYLDLPFNFDGRTDVFHCAVWGTLGLLWVKVGLPLCDKVFSHIKTQNRPYKICTLILSVYLAVDIAVTITALLRADERTHGEPPRNAVEEYYDHQFTNEFLSSRFENMGGLGEI